MFSAVIMKIEPSLISNFAFSIVLAFGYLLSHSRKIFLGLAAVIMIALFSFESFAIGYFPGGCGTLCLANQRSYNNYYRSQNPCFGNSGPWQGSYAFPHYPIPWGSTRSQVRPYAPYGNCYNCSTQYAPSRPYSSAPRAIQY